MEYPPTPTLDKVIKVAPQSQVIGEFMEWLSQEGITLCQWQDAKEVPCYRCSGSGINPDRDGECCPVCGGWPSQRKGAGTTTEPSGYFPERASIDSLLHKYFDIDPQKEEEERKAVLEYVRKVGGD